MHEWKSVHLPYQLDAHDTRRISHRTDRLIELAKKAVWNITRPRILDVGSGRGEFIAAAKERLNAEILSVDVDPVCVEAARVYGTAFQGELTSVLADHEAELTATADLVVSSHSLEHMPDPIGAIAAMKKITRGPLLIALPNPHFLPMIVKVVLLNRIPQINKGHYWAWDAPHLAWFLEGQNGLDIVEWGADWVQIVPHSLSRLSPIGRVADVVEARLLPRLFPRLAESLIVLCRKRTTS